MNNTSTAQGPLKAQLKANEGCRVQSLQEKWGSGPDTNLQHVKASVLWDLSWYHVGQQGRGSESSLSPHSTSEDTGGSRLLSSYLCG